MSGKGKEPTLAGVILVVERSSSVVVVSGAPYYCEVLQIDRELWRK
jgi:hypothetical protein